MLLSSCATIVHGTSQSISISSCPSNASIWIDGIYYGQSPMVVKLARQDNHMVNIQLEGYQPYQMFLTKQVSGWVFGNIIFGGIIGIAVDAITGGIYRLTPEQVHAEMCENTMSVSKKGELLIVLKPKDSWQKIGQLELAK